MTKVIAIANQKGGVGKTSTTVNLGAGLVRQGYDVLLIDLDSQANLTMALGYQNPDEMEFTITNVLHKAVQEEQINPAEGILTTAEGIDLMPSNVQLSGLELSLINEYGREAVLKQYIEEVRLNYDFILIDCAPSLSVMTVNALVASDSVLIPTQPQYFSMAGIQMFYDTFCKETTACEERPMKRMIVCLLTASLLLTGCTQNNMDLYPLDKDGMERLPYHQIDQEQAMLMMEYDDGHVIVDVRRQDEYDAGHIPGAICIPNESIGTEPPEELPDRSQVILIYCRSGNRSKQAAEKLGKMGYHNVYEFGGIIDWKGEIVTTGTKTEATLTFDSFDGGGPEFEIELDSDIITCTRRKEYFDANHDELDGAAFRIIYTFTGVAPGETAMIVKERSPIAGNYDHRYSVKVDEQLNVSIEKLETIDWDEMANAIQPVPTLVISANGKVFYGELEDNPSAQAFIDKLSSEAIEVEMHDYGHFEKVGPLPWSLPRTDENITTRPGDVILYQGNQITIYYDQNTWDFTRLARIGNVTKEELLSAFGEGNVTVKLWIEWSE